MMVRYKDFTVGEIFRLVNPKGRLTTRELIEGDDIPYVAAKKTNNGVAMMCSRKNIPDEQVMPGNCIVFVQQGDGSAGYTTYQPDDFYAISCVCCGYIDGILNEEIGMYLMAVLDKNKAFYSHSNSWSGKKLTETKMPLPVTTVMMPDWGGLALYLTKVGGGGYDMRDIDTSSWKKFKISDLFVSQSGNVDIQKVHINGKGTDVVSSGVKGNGIIGKSDIEAKIFPAGTLTVDMFGNVFYRDTPYKMVTHARVFSLSLKEKTQDMNTSIGLFLATSLSLLLEPYSFDNMATFDKIASLEILLPATSMEVPDWDYMQERIAELEQERIAELEQYLVATGLNDYTLTDEDLKTLSNFQSDKAGNRPVAPGVRKEMRDFAVDKLMNLQKITKMLSKSDLSTVGIYPAYSSDTANGGIIGYTSNPEFICDESTPVYITFGDHTRTMNIARISFSVLDNVKVLIPCIDNDAVLLYIIVEWQKHIQNLGYARHWKIARDCMLRLPVQTDAAGQLVIDEAKSYHPDGFVPDWEYMAAYIRAIEKLVIRDVVDFKDVFIAQTRDVVGNKAGR